MSILPAVTLPSATAVPAIEVQGIDTGIVLTFDTPFALSAAIIGVIRDLGPDERTETIADMIFFASFARTSPEQRKALTLFWTSVRDLFELEAQHPEAVQGDEPWHDARLAERRAAICLMSADVRDIHLPGCATFMIN